MWTFPNNGDTKFHLIRDNVLVSANRVGGKAPSCDHRVKINQGTTKSRPIIVENLTLVTAKSELKSLAFTKFDHFLSYCVDFIGRARLNGPP